MILKEITLHKQMKMGLPNYSSIAVGVSITATITDGERPDTTMLWTSIDKQIEEQLKKHK